MTNTTWRMKNKKAPFVHLFKLLLLLKNCQKNEIKKFKIWSSLARSLAFRSSSMFMFIACSIPWQELSTHHLLVNAVPSNFNSSLSRKTLIYFSLSLCKLTVSKQKSIFYLLFELLVLLWCLSVVLFHHVNVNNFIYFKINNWKLYSSSSSWDSGTEEKAQ